jgi:hypothetical protein
LPRAKVKYQVVQLRLNSGGKVAKQTNIGLPTTKRKAEEVHLYQATKEFRADVKYVIVEVPNPKLKKV